MSDEKARWQNVGWQDSRAQGAGWQFDERPWTDKSRTWCRTQRRKTPVNSAMMATWCYSAANIASSRATSLHCYNLRCCNAASCSSRRYRLVTLQGSRCCKRLATLQGLQCCSLQHCNLWRRWNLWCCKLAALQARVVATRNDSVR